MVAKRGFYDLPIDEAGLKHFERLGLSVRVVCVSKESGLDFGVDADTPTGRAAQRRAYHNLAVELGCVKPISGVAQIIAPRPVQDASALPDEELVQSAKAIGFMARDNDNPACLGMIVHGTGIGVASCHTFEDPPSSWWTYTGTVRGAVFVVTGVLKCDWRETQRHVVGRYVDLIREQVTARGLKFNPEYLRAWMSPAATAKNIDDDEVLMLLDADEDSGEFIELDGGSDPERPHALDVTGLITNQMFVAGLPENNFFNLPDDTITARGKGGEFKWSSGQREGNPPPAHSIIAGAVRLLGR